MRDQLERLPSDDTERQPPHSELKDSEPERTGVGAKPNPAGTSMAATAPGSVGVLSEIRTQRLALVDEAGVEQAVLRVDHGVVELSIGGSQSALPCEVLIYAGETRPDEHSAGVELWVNGTSVAGGSVTATNGQAAFHAFKPRPR